MTSRHASKRRSVDAKGRNPGPAKHVRFYHWLVNSDAYRAACPGERALLVEIYHLHNGQNNGEIELSQRHAGTLVNVTKDTAAKYLAGLQDKGLIRMNRPGRRAARELEREPATWILTEFEFDGKEPTKEFMKWRPAPTKGMRENK